MLFKKYQLMIFKNRHGSCSSIIFPGWLFLAGVVLILAVAGSNIYLWSYYKNYQTMHQNLHRSEHKVQTQKIQLTSLYSKVRNLEQDLQRVKEFDQKLRVMLDLAPAQAVNPNPLGGITQNSPSPDFPLYRQEVLARQMHSFLDQLSTEARLEEIRQQEILQALHRQKNILGSTPSIWPAQGWVSSDFGYRTSPFTGQREFHRGIDISAPEGTPIYAPAAGRVTFTGRDGAYGITMIIDHGQGMTTRYAHLQRYVAEKKQDVSRGQLIGYVGNTGRSTGPHLHYEVRVNNMPVNPKKYILN